MKNDLHSFLNKIQKAGVILWVDGSDIRVNGPNNILTPETIEFLKNHKKEIIQILQQNDLCIDCEYAEHINPIGRGCVNKTQGYWEEQWISVDKLDECPMGFWN